MKLYFMLLLGLFKVDAGTFSKIVTVDSLEINKYLGRWFEIYSSLIQRQTFQKDSFCTMADYSLRDDGKINVFNAGRIGKPTGPPNNITGTAFVVDKNQPGGLNVEFPNSPASSGANYLVVKLGPATFGDTGMYEYTVITAPWKSMLWVLARDPDAFKMKYDKEVKKYLKDNGYTWFWNRPRETAQGKDCIYAKH